MSRPTIKTPELIETILMRIMKGESVKAICAPEGMPNEDTIYEWILRDAEFSEKYARAKEVQMEKMAEEIIEISDDNSRDAEAFVGVNHVQRARLKVDSRKWLMSKLAPKKYGDKLDINQTGSIKIDWHEERSETDLQADAGDQSP